MRYLNIFFLSLQEVFEARSRLVVWVIWAAIVPSILIFFWRGAKSLSGWTINEVTSYYLLVVIGSVFLMCHHENKIATLDIKEGGLTAYLLKPISYIKMQFFNELSYRVIEGTFSILLLGCFVLLFPHLFVFVSSPFSLLVGFLIVVSAIMLTFLFKTCVGLMAFWMTEARGLFETVNITTLIFSGMLMPLAFYPEWLEKFVYLLPFPFMIYFPIIALEGKLLLPDLIRVLLIQLLWISIFYFLYKILWHAGIKKYTAVGQ